MPAISARTAPAEITLISAAFAAAANSVRTVASTEARARLIAFLPCSFRRDGELATGWGVSLGAQARRTSGWGAVPAVACYTAAVAQTRNQGGRHEACKQACERTCGFWRRHCRVGCKRAGRRRQDRVPGGLCQRRDLYDPRPP